MEAFEPKRLPLNRSDLDPSVFMESLIDATARLEVYKSKLVSSKLGQDWFLPTLQKREAWASSLLEGTQATLDGVLVDQVIPNEKDRNIREVRNYVEAAKVGYHYLQRGPFSVELVAQLHKTLMSGNVRRNKSTIPGEFRTEQNYLGHGAVISYIPPRAESVQTLMANFVDYFNDTEERLRPLVRAAIMHAQFETIHPFMDGNGRVGRILIPLFLYKHHQIALPCFFISEALEHDKYKYYDLLNGIRTRNDWSSWINFFLQVVEQQCSKYIEMVDQINVLYQRDLEKAKSLIRSNKVVDLMNLLYKYPVINTAIVISEIDIPSATATRYMNTLVESRILYANERMRNRTFYYYDLLNVIR